MKKSVTFFLLVDYTIPFMKEICLDSSENGKAEHF